MAYVYDVDLEFLAQCTNEDLQPLVDILTKDKDGKKRYTEGLTSSRVYKVFYPDHNLYWKEIAEEIQKFGANTIATLFRLGKGVSYKTILIEVCEKMKVNFNKESSTELIEKHLLDKVLTSAIEELSEDDLKKLAEELKIPATHLGKQSLTALVLVELNSLLSTPVLWKTIHTMFPQTIGTLLAGTALGRILGFATGPIGWGITGIWALKDISGPATRVTVPAVIQIAFLRKKYSINN
ncbi:DUF3944 domain-containing protein [Glaesserella parasuis]|uniref:DUF3944 domain-containing protein n=10 Tax=Glaesserella parasuis TaxID=738 RepID=B8F3T8_GLAP5|nr:DUF3944 domain-containing protein [Glaesserella parasuis]AGO16206.1 hypothetical protein K756_05005 [Glaesserella parasuis ZJ0906]ACL31990.1 conserved hypothetical protein [Glaesserella parasuis SH0165]AIK17104.1 hypothetical protein JL26_04495 [Glaesserella parasuis]AIK89609.1 hypothetical protein JT17_02065 [Glaesserella parasuis]ATW45630.1 hypothetical protein A2U21_06655 [Glaesserella parasuis str. Nagasaki]